MIAAIYGRAVAEESERLRQKLLMSSMGISRGHLFLLLGPDEYGALVNYQMFGQPMASAEYANHHEFHGMRIIRAVGPIVEVVWAP